MSSHTTIGMKMVYTRAVVVISLKFIPSCPTLVCIALEKEQFYFLVIPSHGVGENWNFGKLEVGYFGTL